MVISGVKNMRREKSCGVVAYKTVENVNNYLLIKGLNGDIGFPKGHVEAGESETETAIRELKEETGAEVKIIPRFRREIEYPIGHKGKIIKKVVYFLGRITSDKIVPQEKEIAEAGFLPYDEAMRVITFDDSRNILADAEALINSISDL